MDNLQFISDVIKVATDESRPAIGLMSKESAIGELLKERTSGALNLMINIQQTSAGYHDMVQRFHDLAKRFGLSYSENNERFY